MNALTRDLVKLVETAEQSQKTREELSVSDRKFREKLHLMPPVGWLNDPNGLCQFQGIYHAFFQYSPFDAEGGVKMWGHYTSTNMIDWEYQGTALYPDQFIRQDDFKMVFCNIQNLQFIHRITVTGQHTFYSTY